VEMDAWQRGVGLAGLLINGVGLSFVAVQMRLGRKGAARAQLAQSEELVRRKRQATLEFLYTTADHRRSLHRGIPDDFDEMESRQFAARALAGDLDLSTRLNAYFAYLEIVATGVSSGIYDLETVDSTIGQRMGRAWENYRDFLLEMRAGASKSGSRYRELEWIIGKLEEFRQEPGRYAPDGRYVPLAERENRGDGVEL
jgi:hypothetical protein